MPKIKPVLRDRHQRMYFGDHNPPHFHAHYGGEEALVEIGTLAVMAGSFGRGQ